MNDRELGHRAQAYWERAGEVGYARAMYKSADVEQHVRQRVWTFAIDIADKLGIPRHGRVLDYGCGDGAFANKVLAKHYQAVDGYDLSGAAIQRANAEIAGTHLRFAAVDLLRLDYSTLPQYDGAFLMGILHHIKSECREALCSLGTITARIVVLEPNGSNVLRKALEFTPGYRRAGEESFGSREISNLFSDTGWHIVERRRLNLFPNFTPDWIYRRLAAFEPRLEKSRFCRTFCTVNMFGLTRR